MQTRKPQLQRQQVIMAKLGFYRHRCDGIWGPESIAAKRKWEADRSFIPALPNNGLPFGERDPFPKGIFVKRPERLLTMADLTYEEEERFLRRGMKTSKADQESESPQELDTVQDSASESEPEQEDTSEPASEQPEPNSVPSYSPEPQQEEAPPVPQFTGKKKKKRG
tara:strand:- start:85097 stop:85597 length:501 start_codon:yes stop_codon:yes gene_type:complete